MLRLIHPLAGAVALLTIATFWISTVAVEALGTPTDIARLKDAILWGMLVLVPAMAIAGASGMRLGRTSLHPLVEAKQSRMPIIALNGLLVLVPAAFFLANRAAAGMFDQVFYTVQAIELAAGAFNFYLLVLAMRDGFRLTGRFGFQPAAR
ncbi:hypothetical protein F1193_08225 [Blastochloris sulfoviridis]|uniref:Transmembrane protein n=1 Tax=Blastochloris sulfoviridis TaxID=50712 RepID=A0A5M6I1B0_9HYPH|nr:hypothetical protein [Blastochloris sulfoviridis]KAA5601952.1 hypothetical protein F1193_08225 [Blastochloris sulfoviridis]